MSEIEIRTSRLLLRPVTPQDSGPFTQAVNDPRIYLMLASVPPEQTKAQTLAWIATHDRAREEDTGHFYAITMPEGGLCGIISATRAQAEDPFEIGYWLMPEYWGKGLCTEAGAGLIRWLESARRARVLVAGHFADNPASGRILTKLGFLPCGRSPMYSKGRGIKSDHVMMARVS
ncbi:MAG: GNAT family N-acetyltransferase [Hyphomonas sp.]|nr:GNAT family N-acetyltransferase [Hyphomonas sp.]